MIVFEAVRKFAIDRIGWFDHMLETGLNSTHHFPNHNNPDNFIRHNRSTKKPVHFHPLRSSYSTECFEFG